MDLTNATQSRCPGCDAPVTLGDLFCEQCGVRLAGEETGIEADGDRVELDQGIAATVSDRGRTHRRNEDAFSLSVGDEGHVVAVVCDGISSASAGDVAARTAADAAGARLLAACLEPGVEGPAAIIEAVEAAHRAVGGVTWTQRMDRDAPSCTLVCALLRGGEIVIGSVGDSRAYWLGSEGASQLTNDDSWAEEQVAVGAMTEEEAMNDPRAHTITHWIGGDAPDRPPRVTILHPQCPGRLVLCSDGLWNYAPRPDQLAELVDRLPAEASPAAVARALTDTAVERGGRDNITVSVIEVNPSGGNP